MAAKIHGRLGAVNPAATTNTLLYLVPAGRKATFNLNVANQGAAATIRVAYVDATSIGSVAAEDYVEYETPLAAAGTLGGVLLRTGEPINENCLIMVRASTANVSFVAYGIEEDITT